MKVIAYVIMLLADAKKLADAVNSAENEEALDALVIGTTIR